MVMAPSATCTLTEDIYTTAKFEDFNKIHLNNHGHVENRHVSNELVLDLLKEQIKKIDTDTCDPGEEDAFYVADLGEVYRQHLRWKMNLGRVKPFYGMLTLFLAKSL